MQYVVYDKKTGQIIRTYRKVLGESGETVPADESDVCSDLPAGVSRDDVEVLSVKELALERGKVYRVDPDRKEVVSAER